MTLEPACEGKDEYDMRMKDQTYSRVEYNTARVARSKYEQSQRPVRVYLCETSNRIERSRLLPHSVRTFVLFVRDCCRPTAGVLEWSRSC